MNMIIIIIYIQDFTMGEEVNDAKIYDIKGHSKKIIKDEKVSLNNISNPFIKAERNYKIVI